MREVLLFEPLYQERVWGGRLLQTVLGRPLPPHRPIGESWEVVDRPAEQSKVRSGSLAGLTLREVLERHGAAIMGPAWPPQRPFPILVKWLDCRERLSLQVHPPASVAPALGGEPKTENWFVARAAKGATLIVGLNPGVGRAEFERAIESGLTEGCVRVLPVASGDSILVRSGQVHAIDAGNLILEIQQNSDTTYRVYDWGRTGLDGRPRQLHVAESLSSILWDEPAPEPVRAAPLDATLAECEEFRIRRVVLKAGGRLHFAAGEEPRLLGVISGSLEGSGALEDSGTLLEMGDNALLPYAASLEFTAGEPATILVTDCFGRPPGRRA